MPDQRKTQQLDIEIHGSVDSSLAKAIGVTEAQLAKLKDAVATINRGFNKEAFAGASEGFKQADEAAKGFHDTMKRIGETMAGVFSAEMATRFFETAIEGAKKLGEFMKEAGVQAATMEQMQTQLRTQMPTGTTPKQIEELTNALQYFSDTTPFRMGKVFDSFRELLVARVGIAGLDPKTGEYKSVDVAKVMDVIKQIGEIASATTRPGESPSEHYAAIATAIQQSLLGGNLMEKTLRPLEYMGLEIRPWLEQKYGLVKGSLGALGSEEDTEALHTLYKKIKKGEVPAFDILEYLKDVGGPGGKYSGSIEAHSTLAITAFSTLLDKLDTVMRGIGKIELGPFEDIINKINSSFTPEAYLKIQDFFDKASEKSKAWMDNLMNLFGAADKGGLSKSIGDMVNTMTELGKDILKMLPDNAAKVQAIIDKLSAVIELLVGIGGIVRGIDKVISLLGHIDDVLFGWLPKIAAGGVPLTDQQRADMVKDAQARAAKGGHIEEKPGTTPATLPHKQAGGVVTRATALVAGEAGPEAILPLTALRDHPLVRLTEESIKIQGTEAEATIKLTDTITKLTESIATMQQNMAAGGMGGGFGLGSGYGGGGGMTEYGASVPGDQPGGPTYDWNSYHGIGAFTQHLVPGQDVAMSQAYARGHYGIAPLGFYVSDKDHKMHRWADVTGSKDPTNEDLYRGALGGLITRPTKILAGERGPEALVPLAGGGGGLVTLHYSPTIHGFGDVAGLLREHADELLSQVEHALSTRFAAMAAV